MNPIEGEKDDEEKEEDLKSIEEEIEEDNEDNKNRKDDLKNIVDLRDYINNMCYNISGIKTISGQVNITIGKVTKKVEQYDLLYKYYFLLFVHRIHLYYINKKDKTKEEQKLNLTQQISDITLINKINEFKKKSIANKISIEKKEAEIKEKEAESKKNSSKEDAHKILINELNKLNDELKIFRSEYKLNLNIITTI